MMRRSVLLMLGLTAMACSPWPPDTVARPIVKVTPVVLTDRRQLDQHLGKTVTLRGEVLNTKTLQILGVDVDPSGPDLRGQVAEATGVLWRYEVLPKDLDYTIANRGAGVFYRLQAIDSPGLAEARRATETPPPQH